MVDNFTFSRREYMDDGGDPRYDVPYHISDEGRQTEFNHGYSRSSTSSSSTGSGKQLVSKGHNDQDSIYRRLERSHGFHGGGPSGLHRNQDLLTPPEIQRQAKPTFFIGAPSTPESQSGYLTPNRLSPDVTPKLTRSSQAPTMTHLAPPNMLTQAFLADLNSTGPPCKRAGSLYDTYLHIPRANLWCSHKDCLHGDTKCSQCQLREDSSSTCSSINPPPTFTALDNNYQPRISPQKCSCGAVFVATTALSILVLLLIAAFIIYIETVLKRTQYIPDPMK